MHQQNSQGKQAITGLLVNPPVSASSVAADLVRFEPHVDFVVGTFNRVYILQNGHDPNRKMQPKEVSRRLRPKRKYMRLKMGPKSTLTRSVKNVLAHLNTEVSPDGARRALQRIGSSNHGPALLDDIESLPYHSHDRRAGNELN